MVTDFLIRTTGELIIFHNPKGVIPRYVAEMRIDFCHIASMDENIFKLSSLRMGQAPICFFFCQVCASAPTAHMMRTAVELVKFLHRMHPPL